nr:MAG TPA: hypothetical protein [Caudoviricetes sp.]
MLNNLKKTSRGGGRLFNSTPTRVGNAFNFRRLK